MRWATPPPPWAAVGDMKTLPLERTRLHLVGLWNTDAGFPSRQMFWYISSDSLSTTAALNDSHSFNFVSKPQICSDGLLHVESSASIFVLSVTIYGPQFLFLRTPEVNSCGGKGEQQEEGVRTPAWLTNNLLAAGDVATSPHILPGCVLPVTTDARIIWIIHGLGCKY